MGLIVLNVAPASVLFRIVPESLVLVPKYIVPGVVLGSTTTAEPHVPNSKKLKLGQPKQVAKPPLLATNP